MVLDEFCVNQLVDVPLVKVARFTEIELGEKFSTCKVVTEALAILASVIVVDAIVPVPKTKFPSEFRLVVKKLVVVAFVPVALVNKRLVKVDVNEFNILEKKLVVVAAEMEAFVEYMFVEVALVNVAKVNNAFGTNKLVIVAVLIIDDDAFEVEA